MGIMPCEGPGQESKPFLWSGGSVNQGAEGGRGWVRTRDTVDTRQERDRSGRIEGHSLKVTEPGEGSLGTVLV